MPVGFDRAAAPDVVTLSFDPITQGYSPERAETLRERMLERARSLPGVRAAALTELLPLSNRAMADTLVPAGNEKASGGEVFYATVSPGFFATLGIDLVAGRDFARGRSRGIDTGRDRQRDPRAPVLAGREPARPPHRRSGQALRDLRGGRRGARREVREPDRARSSLRVLPAGAGRSLQRDDAARPRRPGISLTDAIRRAARELDPALPLFQVETLADSLRRNSSFRREGTLFVAAFGVLALVLAGVGLYGVVAFAVGERRREIGVRIALGARARDVVALFVRRGARLAAIGLAVGLRRDRRRDAPARRHAVRRHAPRPGDAGRSLRAPGRSRGARERRAGEARGSHRPRFGAARRVERFGRRESRHEHAGSGSPLRRPLARQEPGLRRRRGRDARARNRHGHDDLLDPRRRRAPPAPLPRPGRADDGVRSRTRTRTRPAETFPWSYPKFESLRRHATSFQTLAAWVNTDLNLTGVAEPERLSAELVSAAYFPTLGVSPILGRTFSADEDRGGTPGRVAALSWGLWQRRFAGDRAGGRQDDPDQPRDPDDRRRDAGAFRRALRQRRGLGADVHGREVHVPRRLRGGREPLAQRGRAPKGRRFGGGREVRGRGGRQADRRRTPHGGNRARSGGPPRHR